MRTTAILASVFLATAMASLVGCGKPSASQPPDSNAVKLVESVASAVREQRPELLDGVSTTGELWRAGLCYEDRGGDEVVLSGTDVSLPVNARLWREALQGMNDDALDLSIDVLLSVVRSADQLAKPGDDLSAAEVVAALYLGVVEMRWRGKCGDERLSAYIKGVSRLAKAHDRKGLATVQPFDCR